MTDAERMKRLGSLIDCVGDWVKKLCQDIVNIRKEVCGVYKT